MVDERTRNRRGWLLFGLAILSLVLVFCTCSDSRRIETDLLARGQTELDSAGLDPELIQVDGRDVTLTGVVENTEARLAASAAVAALPGVRLLNNNLQTADTAAPSSEAEPEAATDEPRLLLELNEAEPSLSGNVDEATANLATEVLTPASDEPVQTGPDTQNLDSQAAEATPEWFSGVIALAPEYAAQVEAGSLELTPERLTLNGLVPDEAARVELGETFSIAAGDSVNIVNQLRIVAAQAPTGLTFTVDEEDGLNLSGEVSETAAMELSSALTPLGVNNTLELNDNVEDPAWLGDIARLTPDFVQSVDEASLSVTEDNITLGGTVPSEEDRAAQVEAFEQAAAGTQVTDNLLLDTADTQTQTAELADAQAPSLSLLESGENITLSGAVAPTTSERTEQSASDFSGDVSINLATTENVSVPDWLSDLVGYLPTYSDSVQDARLELSDNSLILAGTVPSEAERDALENATRERVGDEITITNELVVVESDPANFRLETSEAGTRLSGTLPQSAATSLVDTLTPVTPDIRDDLAISDVSTPAWLPQVIEGVPSYTGAAQDAVLELEGETLTLGGAVDSEAQKQALAERISELSGGEAEVINNLEVKTAENVEEPVEEATEDVAEAGAETPAEPVENPAEEPAEIEATEPEAAEIEAAEPDVAEPDVLELDIAEQAEEATEESVTQAEPVEANDPVEASEVSESQTPPSEPNLRIDVSSGAITLSGVVPDEELRSSAAQGYTKTVNNTLELGTTDEAILAPVIALGPDFAASAERGSLNLQGDTLTLQGVVADEATRTALFDAASGVGPNITVVNRLSLASSIPQTEDGK